jgi:hypothetical protein
VLNNSSHEHTVHSVGSKLGFSNLLSALFDQINVLFPLFDYPMGSDTLGLGGVQSTISICGITTDSFSPKPIKSTVLAVQTFASASASFTTVASFVSNTELALALTVGDTMDVNIVNSTASIVLIEPVHTLSSTIGILAGGLINQAFLSISGSPGGDIIEVMFGEKLESLHWSMFAEACGVIATSPDLFSGGRRGGSLAHISIRTGGVNAEGA